MAHFRYQALNTQRETIAGELEAASVSEAITALEAQGLTVLSIGYSSPDSAGRAGAAGSVSTPPHRPPTRAVEPGEVEREVLRRHMTAVLQHARTLVPALRAYAEELPRGGRRRELEGVIRILERGDADEAALALEQAPGCWIPLFRASASSPDAGRMLGEFLGESQREEELRRQWWLTLAYPAFVALLAGAVMVALSFLVIPIFRDIFEGFGLQLSAFTVVVINLAESITSGEIVLILGAIVVGLFLLWQARKLLPYWLRAGLDDSFGTPLGRTTALARLGQFTADLLEAGLAVPDALRIAGFASRSTRLRRGAWRLATQVESHDPVDAKHYRWIITGTFLHAAAADMPLAARSRLMRELSTSYAERARMRFSWTRGLIEPLAIGVLGIVVGGAVIALFSPLITLIQGLAF